MDPTQQAQQQSQQAQSALYDVASAVAPHAGAVVRLASNVEPERLPTFSALASSVDRFASRLPWWAVAALASGATWWIVRRRAA